MILRAVLATLFAASLVSLPATASQPEGPVARLITNPLVTLPPSPNGLPQPACGGFHWSQIFPARQLDPDDTVTMQMAIIPFRSSSTAVLLFEPVGPSAFAHVEFRDGFVNGLPYNRSDWNDVSIQLHPATQDFVIAVNGLRAGPFPYEASCQRQGGCFSLEGFGLSGSSFDDGAVAWVDSITIVRESAAGQEMLFEQTFETCGGVHADLGGLLISNPPQRASRRTHGG